MRLYLALRASPPHSKRQGLLRPLDTNPEPPRAHIYFTGQEFDVVALNQLCAGESYDVLIQETPRADSTASYILGHIIRVSSFILPRTFTFWR